VLGGTEVIAFYQLWNMMDISRDKYATLIVNGLLGKMSTISA
jgi:fluoride ion exporter CrcB/FEX